MKKLILIAFILALTFALSVPVFAAGDVSGVIESTWKTAAQQIKAVVDKVVFPALDMILAVAFFIKLGALYFDYRRHNQIEWAGPIMLFACLVFSLTAPLYIWQILGI